MDIKFNDREFKRQIQKAAQEGVDRIAKDWTRDMERLSVQYKGKPIDTIKPALKRLAQRHGGTLSDSELSQWAQMISEGTKIVFKPERHKF